MNGFIALDGWLPREHLRAALLGAFISMGAFAVLLIWASARFLKQRARPFQLALLLALVFSWSYVGVFHLDRPLEAHWPIFALVGLAAAWWIYRYRGKEAFLGAGLLTCGFALWGIFVSGLPGLPGADPAGGASHAMSAVVQFLVMSGLIVVALEEVRQFNTTAVQELRSYKSKTDFLKKKVASTEERYRSLFDQASEGIVIADAQDLRLLELNQTARRLLGVSGPDAALLSSFCRIHPEPDPRPRTGSEWFALICRHRTLTLVRRDGATTPAEADGAPIQFEGRPAYQFFLRELSERARLEQQLRQAEKLSALGQMISGVAHELNNPLAVIKGYMELMLRRDALSPQMRSELEKVARESNRAAKLVSNFLSFAREQPLHRERVDLNELVRAVVDSRQTELPDGGAILVVHTAPDLPATEVDPDQVRQALVNVLNNALQAVALRPAGGRVRILTLSKNDLIQVRVEDNGPGVPPEVLPHIFEPFFTTREVGQGTGLGLSIAHSILSDHGGRIFHETPAGGGACFVLEFPVVRAAGQPAPTAARPATATAPEPATAPARILVLDDDPTIAELLGEMIGLLGYSPTLCNSGPDALEMIGRREFDVIISDFRMPKMNGQEFYYEAVRRRPALAPRIVFLTGDVVNDETQAFLKSTGNPHLSKPFQLARVEQTLAEVLRRNLAAS